MKYLIIGLLFLSTGLKNAPQENTVVWHTDMMKAVDISIMEKKPLFLFFTGSDWCGWCKRLHSEVFSTTQFQTWAKKNVVLVELDFPRNKPVEPQIQQQNSEIAQMFGIRGYPTGWFVTATKDSAQVFFTKLGSTGYVPGGPEAWIASADAIIKSQP